MDMLADRVREYLKKAAEAAGVWDPDHDKIADIPLETPKNRAFGHFATNMPFKLAKTLRKPPMELARTLADSIPNDGFFENIEVAPPGFVNLRVAAPALQDVIAEVAQRNEDYGKSSIGKGKKVQVEFVSANPTGPLSIGHGRLAAFGDVIAELLGWTGWTTEREFYVNDVGNQIVKLVGTVLKRMRQLKGENILLDEDDYQDEYLIEVAGEAIEYWGQPQQIDHLTLQQSDPLSNDPMLLDFKNIGIIGRINEDQKKSLSNFHIKFNEWFHEGRLYKSNHGEPSQIERTIELLKSKQVSYLEDNALWFRTSTYGDEKDRVIQKSDGTKTYFLSDIAYIENKLGVRKFNKVIYVWGADHHGYVPRMKAAAEALGYDRDRLEILIIQLVSIKGERMSKRRGNIIYLDELIEEVGVEPARFFFLMRARDTHLDFDMDLARDKSEANPLYYLQYAHARVCSIMEKARGLGMSPDPEKRARLTDPLELDLLKTISDFPWEVQSAAVSREPLRVINYLTNLAAAFHTFYHKIVVIREQEPDATAARLALCDAIRITMRNGLKLLGLSAPERM